MNNSLKQLNNLTGTEKQAIDELIFGLEKLYGDNLSRVILYGSKARGDSTPESDIDILAVLKKMGLRYDEIDKITKISAPLCLKYNLVISVFPMEENQLTEDYRTIFIHNVLKEGLEV